MGTIRDRILLVQENIARACKRAGRNPAEITLVAVTKYTTLEKVAEAIHAGVTHIGENRVQDAEEKFKQLGELAGGVTKHMIGHLQTNKAKNAISIFDMIQSVDSIKLAQEIEKRAVAQALKTVDVLIEVNSGEEQKSGVEKIDLPALVDAVAGCEHIQLKGLMTMAPYVSDKEVIRKAFRDLRNLSEKLSAQMKGHSRFEMKYLSMGMTQDYEIAIEEGSTMVRIGTAIFKET